jgi:L-threonylcarbamoyladenylate synthase
VIAYPTDTVYGIGSSIRSAEGIKKTFLAKGKDFKSPLLIAVADFSMLREYCRIDEKILMRLKEIWPGAISVILPKKETVSDLVTAGLPDVGVRFPDHEITLKLIRTLGHPIISTSANHAGCPDVTEASAIKPKVDFTVAGKCRWGKSSTLVDLTAGRILRRGAQVELAERWLNKVKS